MRNLTGSLYAVVEPSDRKNASCTFTTTNMAATTRILTRTRTCMGDPRTHFYGGLFTIHPSVRSFIARVVVGTTAPATTFVRSIISAAMRAMGALRSTKTYCVMLPGVVGFNGLPVSIMSKPTRRTVKARADGVFGTRLLGGTGRLYFSIVRISTFNLRRRIFGGPYYFNFSGLAINYYYPYPLSNAPTPSYYSSCC